VIGELALLAVTSSVSLIPGELRRPSRMKGPTSTSSAVSVQWPFILSCAIKDKLSTELKVVGKVPTRLSLALLSRFDNVSTVPAGEVNVMTRSVGPL